MVILEKSTEHTDWVSRFCLRLVVFVGKHRPKILQKYIQEHAEKFAIKLTMSILDKEGINHCAYCPRRFQLRKMNNGQYICPTCIELVKREKGG